MQVEEIKESVRMCTKMYSSSFEVVMVLTNENARCYMYVYIHTYLHDV